MIVAELPGTDPTALFGRASTIAYIDRILQQADDAPRGILFRGEPGVGKTAVLDFAASMARARGIQVVIVRGAEYLSGVPYSGLNQLVVALSRFLPALSSDQAEALRIVFGTPPSETPNRLALFSAIARLVGVAAQEQPLLICLDDANRVDRASAEGIIFILGCIGGTAATMLGATRENAGWATAVPGAVIRRLEPLDRQSSEELLDARFPALSARTRRRLLDDAQGNALALIELPAALESTSTWFFDASSSHLPMTERLITVFADRVTKLPKETRDLLLVAALDDSGDLTILRRAIGDPCLSAMTAAEDAGIVTITDSGEQLRFGHPLTRSAIVGASTAAERREAHRRLADAFDDDIDRRAGHLAIAAIEPNEEVAGELEFAARRAAQAGGAKAETAAKLLLRSAALSVDVEHRRRRMAEAAYIGATHPGTQISTPNILSRLLDAEPGSDERLYSAAASAFARVESGHDLEPVFQVVESALAAAILVGNTASSAFASALETLYSICALANRPDFSKRFEAVLTLMPPDGVGSELRVATAMLDPARTFAELAPFVDREVSQTFATSSRQVVSIASSAVYLDRLPNCREALEETIREESASSGFGDVRTYHLLWTEAFQSGRWDEADVILREGRRLSTEQRTYTWAHLFECQSALMDAVRGDGGKCVASAESVLLGAERTGYGVIRSGALYALTLEAFGRRDYEAALAYASRISAPGELPSNVPVALWVFYELVASAIRLGKRSQADLHLRALRDLAIAEISPRYSLLVAAAAAMLGDRAIESSRLLSEAIKDPALNRWPFDLARVQLEQAEFLMAAGLPGDALPFALDAFATMSGLGARPWMDLATELCAQARGVIPTTDVSILTATERKVVTLAASGLTNKQIGAQLYLSDRTVATHLYRAFPKLGVARRAALRDAISGAPLLRESELSKV